MRVITFLMWAIVLVALLWLFLRGRRLPAGVPRGAPLDELVKDPICQTYVVRSRAIRREDAGEVHFFCSDACARRYLVK
jgi:uncharacterized protein